MNNMIKIAGLAALGIASAQSVHAQMSSSVDNSKPWSVSAALRGFYDDNYATVSDKLVNSKGEKLKRDSFGFEVTPSAQLSLIRQQTSLSLNYIFSEKYYEDRVKDKSDQSHQANLKVSHAFTTRLKLDVHDSFVSAQEPSILEPGVQASFLRTEGDNLRNNAGISLAAGLSEEFELVGDYENTYYDYKQSGPVPFVGSIGGFPVVLGFQPSRSALLDRMENSFSLNARYQIVPSTIGVLGYKFTAVDYHSTEALNPGAAPGSLVFAKVRDNDKHDIYAGVDHTFNPQLNASLRLGAEIIDYRSDSHLTGAPSDSTGPYVDARISYAYAVNDLAILGVRHGFNATDVAFSGAGPNTSPVLSAEATTVYAQITHHITAKISATLNAQYQHSVFQGGNDDGKADDFFSIGLMGSYEINRWLSAEAGYNYDTLTSDLTENAQISREFDRNRVYIGIRATY